MLGLRTPKIIGDSRRCASSGCNRKPFGAVALGRDDRIQVCHLCEPCMQQAWKLASPLVTFESLGVNFLWRHLRKMRHPR